MTNSTFKSGSQPSPKQRPRIDLGADHQTARADEEGGDFDDIESLPDDVEHDEEDRDPEPRRWPADSERAQSRPGH